VKAAGELSPREARQLAIAAQGLGVPRPSPRRRPGAPQLRTLMERIGTIQLDAVNVVQRTQFLVPFSRLGAYEPSALRDLTAPGGPWFEYWGHAASLLPLELHRLFRWRMQRWSDDEVENATAQQRRRAWHEDHREYVAAVHDEIAGRGPLTAAQLSDPRRQAGEWWARRSDGRRALELLFGEGRLAAWRNARFERVYDLPERVIPPEVLAAPTPRVEDAQRELMAIAAAAMGVATVTDMANYFWIAPAVARTAVAELVEEGRLAPMNVRGWGRPAYVLPDARPRPPRGHHASLLSPFDSLIWTRDRTERLFGFRYRIEIYVPEPRRTHGYYVMPLLLGDELVARFDLKADRGESTLRVTGAFLEPGADRGEVVEAATAELDRLREWLGLGRITVGHRGDLAVALAAATDGATS